jgi:hypothetical protein
MPDGYTTNPYFDFQWEVLSDKTLENVTEIVKRARIPGGWLYMVAIYVGGEGPTLSTTFVPERYH